MIPFVVLGKKLQDLPLVILKGLPFVIIGLQTARLTLCDIGLKTARLTLLCDIRIKNCRAYPFAILGIKTARLNPLRY